MAVKVGCVGARWGVFRNVTAVKVGHVSASKVTARKGKAVRVSCVELC